MSYASTFKGIKACLQEHLMELIDIFLNIKIKQVRVSTGVPITTELLVVLAVAFLSGVNLWCI